MGGTQASAVVARLMVTADTHGSPARLLRHGTRT